jgi:AcrR family transcriptional regulator
VANHLLQHGIARFSLRSAAHLVGASARMLVHHFGSKERLVSEALALVRTQQREYFVRAQAGPMTSFDRLFHDSWATLAADDYLRYFVLNLEAMALALREPRRYQTFLSTTTEEWRSGLADTLVGLGFSPDEAGSTSSVYVAALRGLLLDLVVTRDRARVDKAVAIIGEKLKDDLTRGARGAVVATDTPGSPGEPGDPPREGR